MSLFLVDGHALVYRAYYAFIRRPLINSKGEETSAIFGFMKTLFNLLDAFDPEYIAVIFDTKEKTFRHQAYGEYKANRKEMPQELIGQLPRIFELLEAMSIPRFSQAGYEADDLIATLVREYEDRVAVRIVSGDKDLFQLVSESTHVLRPGTGGIFEDEIDPRGLVARTGIRPDQFIDYLALMGDASDNVPGVRGIGAKTALKLIQEFDNLDNLYAKIDSVSSPAVRQKLLDSRDAAYLSQQLVTLESRVPFCAPLEDLVRREFNYGLLEPLLEDLEFNRVLDSLKRPAPERETPDESGYRLIDTVEELDRLAQMLARAKEFVVDVEASELDPMRAVLAGIAIAVTPRSACYIPVSSAIEEESPMLTPPRTAPGLPLEEVRRRLGPVLSDARIQKAGHNIKYDALVLANAGIEMRGISFDTMLASYCLHPARRSHGLDALAAELLNHTMTPFKDLFGERTRKKDIREVNVERVSVYACEDADMTLRLKNLFEPLLKASQVERLFREVEMPLSLILTDMERTGIALDVPFLDAASVLLSQKLDACRDAIYHLAGEEFNINSTQKLSEILFDKLELTRLKKTKTGYSTDVDVLKTLAAEHELPKQLLEYRTLSKLKSTYVDALPKLVNPATGRVHTSYNQAVTTTGRLSSSDPNLQNIPIRTAVGREIRKAFVAGGEDWILLDADYSQVELRILAHLSRDTELVAAFEEGSDVHRRTAAVMHGISPGEVTEEMRARAKTVNFGIIYGMGPRGLSQALEIDFKEARAFIEEYFNSYPGVKRFIDETIAAARKEKAVTTLLGRVRQLPDIDSANNRVKSFAERVAVNTPVQGTAADIIKVAMIKIETELRKRKLAAAMILQVHDELLFDLPERELEEVREIVVRSMETAIELSVPLKVDTGTGKNWLEAHG
jgi:DNA polymerase-1